MPDSLHCMKAFWLTQPPGFSVSLINRVMLVMLAVWWPFAIGAAIPGSAQRSGPANYRPGQIITLTNQLAPLAHVTFCTLTENVPPGWTFTNASDNATFDPVLGRIRWSFFDNQVRMVTFSLVPPANATGVVSFAGEASFEGQLATVKGLQQLFPVPPASGIVTRHLPLFFRPGNLVTGVLNVVPEPAITAYGVEENLPAGWRVLTVDSGGTTNSSNRIKWGPFLDNTQRVLTYTLEVPPGTSDTAVFTGTGSFEQSVVSITGATTIVVKPLGGGGVTRMLPFHYTNSVSLTVMLQTLPDTNTIVYAVHEMPPVGWGVSNLSHSGSLSVDGTTIRWGPFLDAVPRTLSYDLAPPANTRSNALFQGAGEFDGASAITTGSSNILWKSLENGSAWRSSLGFFHPGEPVWITNQITPNGYVTIQTMEEILPVNWQVINAGGGTYFSNIHSLRWGPFLDNSNRTIAYQLLSPSNTLESATFTGTVSFGDLSVNIAGHSNLPVLFLAAGTAFRTVQTIFQPGTAIEITNLVQPNSGVGLYVVDEMLPAGWWVTNISFSGGFDANLGRIRWGPFADNTHRALTYTLLTATNARGAFALNGTTYFDGVAIPITGQTNVTANSPPELSPLLDVNAFEDGPISISFSAGDFETPATNLLLTITSSDTNLLRNEDITLGWIGSARSLSMLPKQETAGQTHVTVTVNDGIYSAQKSFWLTLTTTNDTPIITIPPQPFGIEDMGPVHLTNLVISDRDLTEGAALQFLISNAHGTVFLPSLGGAALLAGSNGGTWLMLEGGLPQLNSAISNVDVTPRTNFWGNLHLHLVANDLGSSGGTGPQIGSNIAVIYIQPVNDTPVALDDVLPVVAGQNMKYADAELITNDSDVDNDPLQIAGVKSPSLNGATIRTSGRWVFYEPAPETTLPDSFQYYLTDGQLTVTGNVQVVAVANSDLITNRYQIKLAMKPDRQVDLTFIGAPNWIYQIQATTNLRKSTNWIDLVTVQADAEGRIRFTDSSSTTNQTRCYRLVYH